MSELDKEESAMIAADNMIESGGSFVASIGHSYHAADVFNKAVLLRSFSHYFKNYGYDDGKQIEAKKSTYDNVHHSLLELRNKMIGRLPVKKIFDTKLLNGKPVDTPVMNHLNSADFDHYRRLPFIYMFQLKPEPRYRKMHILEFKPHGNFKCYCEQTGFYYSVALDDKYAFIPIESLALFYKMNSI
jgi:hypothetical protein